MKTVTHFLSYLCNRQLSIIFVFVFFLSFKTTAFNYYWVGGTGIWSDLSHWATTPGGTTMHTQIPTALDDVFFDANSFTAAGQTITLDPTTALAHNFSWAGVTHTPTMAGPSGNLLKLYGSLTLAGGMNITFAGNVDFEATTPGETITMSGKSFHQDVSFNGIGGEWTLQDNFKTDQLIYLLRGTLNTNDKAVNAAAFYSYNYNAQRTLNMGASVFTLSNSGNQGWGFGLSYFWRVADPGAGLVINCGTSTINSTGSFLHAEFESSGFTYYDVHFQGSGPNIFDQRIFGGPNTFHDVSFNAYAELSYTATFHDATFNDDASIAKNNTYNNLNLSAGHTYKFLENKTQTINGAINANGNCGALISISSFNAGSQATFSHTSGPVNVSFVILKDIIAAGGGNFTANSAVDLGGNTGWTINSVPIQNLYWIGGSGNWNDGNHWSLTSGGTPSGCSPTPLDNVFFDANSFSSPSQTVTINVFTAYCRDMTWTGVTNTPTFAGPIDHLLIIYGSLVFVTGMNITFLGDVNFKATTVGKTITMSGNSFRKDASFNGLDGEWTLLDQFATAELIYLLRGTLNTNDKRVNAAAFYSFNYGAQRTLNMGASVFTLSNSGNQGWGSGLSYFWRVADPGAGLHINCGTSTINSTGSFLHAEFQSSGFTYYDVNFLGSGAGIFDQKIFGGPNTFHDVSFNAFAELQYPATYHDETFNDDANIANNNTYHNLNLSAGHTYKFLENKIQTVNGSINANGNCGALINISSFNAGSQTSFDHASGPIDVSYVILKDIVATGAGIFTANSSVDLGNNTGWTIISPASKNLYWIGNNGNWDDGNHWSLTSGGAPSGCSPTPLDNVFFDASSFSAPSQTVMINAFTAYCRDMTWTGVTNTPTLAGPPDHLLQIYGSLTLAAGMNISFAGNVDFGAISAGKTISMYGKSFHNDATFNGVGGEWSLQDNFSTDQLIYLLRGTLNTNDKAVNAAAFYSYNYNAQRTLNMGASVFTLTNSGNQGFGYGLSSFWRVADPGAGLVINCGTSVINSTGSFLHADFESSGFTYYDVNFMGSGANIFDQSIYGNNTFHDVSFNAYAHVRYSTIFHDATFNADAKLYDDNIFHDLNFVSNHTYVLADGSTQAIDNHWQIQGSCTSYIVLQSSTPGSYATVTKPAGTVLGYNIHITDIHCTGNTVFHAYNSVDLGGNTGWQFSSLPALFNPGIISGPAAVCPGATGVIYHTIPVQGAIFYQWTVPPGATIVSGQGDTVIVVNFGTATTGDIVVETFNGCNYGTISSVLTVVLGSIIPAVTIVANPGGPICAGATITFTATAVNTGAAIVTYDFKLNGISMQNGSLNTYTSSALANNDVIICEITLSGSTCLASTTATSNPITVTVNSNAAATVSIDASPGDEVCSGEAIMFTATATNTGGANVMYDFNVNGISVQNANSNTFTTTNLLTGDVVSCLVSLPGNVCAAAGASNSIIMKDGCNHNCTLQIPNAFTPNGDAINDRWIISNRDCFKKVDVFVYNRYGTLLYKKDNYQDDWLGTYKSQPVPDATYYYVIKATTMDGKIEVIRGTVTILR